MRDKGFLLWSRPLRAQRPVLVVLMLLALAAMASTATARAATGKGGSFCSLWAAAKQGDPAAGTVAAPITLEEGSEFTLGGAIAFGSGCEAGGAAINFDEGTLVAGGARFEDVTGTLDQAGLHLRSADLKRPAGWSEKLPARLSVGRLPGAAWGAARTASGWGPLSARIELGGGLELLPLPAGWKFPRGKSILEYAPSQDAFVLHGLARAREGGGGEVSFEGTLGSEGKTAAKIVATDIATLEGPEGHPVGLSGEGELTFQGGKGGGARGSVALTTGSDHATALAGGLKLENAVGKWNGHGIELGGEVRIETKNGPFEAHVTGTFVSRESWKLELDRAGSLPLTEGIALNGLHGSIERQPPPGEEEQEECDDDCEPVKLPKFEQAHGYRTAPGEGKSRFTVDLVGAVHGWTPSARLSDVSVTGQITNACPETASSCDRAMLRLALEISGKAHLRGRMVPWKGLATVNLRTLALRLSGGTHLSGFGPASLNLTNLDPRPASS
jgi:hypothetical protein